MWFKDYEDTPNDTPIKKEIVEPGKGIIGCEMHETTGYQSSMHQSRSRRKGIITIFFAWLFGDK